MQTTNKMSKEFIAKVNELGQKHVPVWYKITDSAIYKVKKVMWYHIGNDFLSLSEEEQIMGIKYMFLPITKLFREG